jgi:hypothetical protein
MQAIASEHHTIRAYGGYGGTALLILNLGIRWRSFGQVTESLVHVDSEAEWASEADLDLKTTTAVLSGIQPQLSNP